jgi:glycosyltransferase involved in cell wall biosynthesis
MYDYACGLSERGHTVDVLTTDVLDATSRAIPAFEVMSEVQVRRLPNLSNSLAWRRKKYLPRGLLVRLRRELGGYDAVHVTDTRTYLTAATALGARLRDVPFCLSPHGSLPGSSGLRGAIKRLYDTALVRPMLRDAALLLAQTDHEASLLRGFGGRDEAIRMLPLPLSEDGLAHPGRSGRFRDRLGLGSDEPLILFLGRIHWLKGLDVLLEALEPRLAARELTVAIVGRDDGQWPFLKSRFERLLANGSVRFAGALYGDARFDAYADADVFCLTPRHWEETSVAALEAAATGTPVVVTEQADIPNLAAAGGGFVVPLDHEAIREAILTAFERRMEMGRAAQALVKQQHGRMAVVEQLEGYLAEVARRRA